MQHEGLPAFDPPADAGKKVAAAIDNSRLSLTAGVLLLRDVERRLGIAKRLVGCPMDRRDPSRIKQNLAEMLRICVARHRRPLQRRR